MKITALNKKSPKNKSVKTMYASLFVLVNLLVVSEKEIEQYPSPSPRTFNSWITRFQGPEEGSKTSWNEYMQDVFISTGYEIPVREREHIKNEQKLSFQVKLRDKNRQTHFIGPSSWFCSSPFLQPCNIYITAYYFSHFQHFWERQERENRISDRTWSTT